MYKTRMDKFNDLASVQIFQERNPDPNSDEIDLHGLFVAEAIAVVEDAIYSAMCRGVTQMRFIVGKGLHSQGGVAKIKPAIEALMQKHRLSAELDPHNSGVLIVKIDSEVGERGMGPEEISHRLEREEESCIIM